MFARHLYRGFALLLWIAAILCLGVYFFERKFDHQAKPEHLYLSIILFAVIFVTATFSYLQERKTSKIMDSFKHMLPLYTTVIREGKTTVIPVEEVVLGDLVVLCTGSRIPADIRIVEADGLKVDNSALTGESHLQSRSTSVTNSNPMETMNLAFFSTEVAAGTGKGIVIACGDSTVMGRVAGLASGLKQEATPIANEIKYFMKLLLVISVLLGLLVLVMALSAGYSVIDSIIYLLGIIIASVPEGMLVTFTLCLSISAKRMANRKCLVKNIEAVETLGSTSVICTDKTGTLTLNKMTVSHIWINQRILDANPERVNSEHEVVDYGDPTFMALWLIAALCSRAEFFPGQDEVEINKRKVIGDASESAVLKFAEMTLGGVQQTRKNNSKICEIPFSSEKKFQVSVHATRMAEDVRYIVVMKGAPERLLERCKTILLNGEEINMDKSLSKSVLDACLQLAVCGERVMAFCDLLLPTRIYPPNYQFDCEAVNFPTERMRFVGLVSMIDPPKSNVPEAVTRCRSAGIKVIMVTGDHPATAKAIAKSVGIISKGSETVDDIAARLNIPMSEVDMHQATAAVITGEILRPMSDKDLDEILRVHSELVFARTSPTQKQMIVTGCQRQGHVVAVTGDGVNDSPALKQADIGIAMGICGTDVARNAADMVLLDDNFSTIVMGVVEGRRIFDNLKKSVAFTLTASTPEILPLMASVAFGIPLPLGTIAIVCINYVTDIWPAISLVFESAESDIMQRGPRDQQNDRLVSSRMLSMTYIQVGCMQACAGFFCYFVIMAEHGFLPQHLFGIREKWDCNVINDLEDSFGQEWTYEERKKLEYTCHTAFFVAILIVQIADVIICKTRRNSLLRQGMNNWPLNWGIIVEVVLAIAIINIPSVQKVLNFYPLQIHWWFLSLPFFFLIIIYDECRRFFIRKYPGSWVERETYY
jgi:sodium/potassium-transporting ATPase subunit alpha